MSSKYIFPEIQKLRNEKSDSNHVIPEKILSNFNFLLDVLFALWHNRNKNLIYFRSSVNCPDYTMKFVNISPVRIAVENNYIADIDLINYKAFEILIVDIAPPINS